MDLTFGDIVRLARRWWWVLVLLPALACASAFAISASMTTKYQAEALLLVEHAQTPGMADYSEILAAERLTSTYSRLAQSRTVQDETVERLGGGLTSSQLEEVVSVAPVADTQLLSVTAIDPDPERAATIANTLSQVFIEQSSQRQEALTQAGSDEIQASIDEAKQQIDQTSARIDELDGGSGANNPDVQAELNSLRATLAQQQVNYAELLEARQRIDISTVQSGTQLRLADLATVPDKPISPRTNINIVLGGVLGILIAAGAVALLGYLDNTVKTREDVQRLTNRAPLAEIPVLEPGTSVVVVSHPHSASAESFRSLRTNVQFAIAGRPMRRIMVTSVRPAEGKSTIAANLAAVLAQSGKRVLLVDADLRKPQVHRMFPIGSPQNGLSTLLLAGGDHAVADAVESTRIPTLQVLPSGILPPNPADILSSGRFKQILDGLAENAEFILIDTPPLAVADPFIVAGSVDGVLLIASSGVTRTTDLTRALADLEGTGTPLLGVVLNRVQRQDRYDYAYGYGVKHAQGESGDNREWQAESTFDGSKRRPARMLFRR